MWSPAPILELSPGVFKILRDLIHDQLGHYYDEGRRELLAEKVSPVAIELGFNNFLDFYYLLKYGPDSIAGWACVADALSVQETYFWREMAQIHALVKEILPSDIVALPSKSIRIWSAACATGEEPLTLAMALAEAGWFDRANIEIVASDASHAAIVKAQRGIYAGRSFRSLPDSLKKKYFSPVEEGWRVHPELHSKITWSVANILNVSEIASLVPASIIFCRNVFIYFSKEAIERTVDLFASKMCRPGYLFVGASESLLSVTDDFVLKEIDSSFVYTLA